MLDKPPRSSGDAEPGSTSDFPVSHSFVPPPEAPESRFFFFDAANLRLPTLESEPEPDLDPDDETRSDQDELAPFDETVEFNVPFEEFAERDGSGSSANPRSAAALEESVPDTGEFVSEGLATAKTEAAAEAEAATIEMDAHFTAMMQDSGDELRSLDADAPPDDPANLESPSPFVSPDRIAHDAALSSSPVAGLLSNPDSSDGFPSLAYHDDLQDGPKTRSGSDEIPSAFSIANLSPSESAASATAPLIQSRADDNDEPEGWKAKAERWLTICLGYYAITITFVAIYLWWTRPPSRDPNPTTEEINKQLDRENQSSLRRKPPSVA